MTYKHALDLYKLFNSETQNDDWIDLNNQQNFNDRVQSIQVIDDSRLKIGKNLFVNRLTMLNNEINFDLMNVLNNTYKFNCKEKFLNTRLTNSHA